MKQAGYAYPPRSTPTTSSTSRVGAECSRTRVLAPRDIDGLLTGRHERCEMDGTEIGDQIKKAELHEAVKQALMRLLDDPQVQQKVMEVFRKRIPQKP